MTITVSPNVFRLLTALLLVTTGVAAGMAVSAATATAVVQDTAYTAVTPCASFDSRTDTGALAGLFTDLESRTYQITGQTPVTQQGSVRCGVPSGAAAVLINIVAVQPQTGGNLRAFATGETGTGGVVNYSPVTPGLNNSNAVTIPLSSSGQLDVQANCGGCPSGTVHARGVILGYYSNNLAARVAALELAQPFAVHADGNQSEAVTETDEVVRSVTVTAPVAGTVSVNSTLAVYEDLAGEGVSCSITTGATLDTNHLQWWGSAGNLGFESQLGATRGFAIGAGETVTYNLVCRHFGFSPSSVVNDSAMTAVFTPNP